MNRSSRRGRAGRRAPIPGAAVTLSVVVLAALTGCSHSSAHADPVAQSFSALPTGTACPAVSLPQGHATPVLPAAVKTCVHEAVARHAVADLAITMLTTEGDPITSHYRVSGGATLEVYVDASKDAFGAKAWQLDHVPCAHTEDDVSKQVCAARGVQ